MVDGLRGKTLILTGASSGIGRALAVELARAGASLVLNARRESLLEDVAALCRADGAKAQAVPGDAARAETAETMVAASRSLGELFGFVHNAGVLSAGPLLSELPEERFREVLDANVTAGYQLVRAAVPELRRRGRGIAVFVGSGAAESNVAGIGAYSVAKAAEEHLARQLAVEAPELTSFVFRPGVVETSMQREAREADGGGADALHRVFRGYRDRGLLRTPEEAARALVRILGNDPGRFSGKVATVEDGSV